MAPEPYVGPRWFASEQILANGNAHMRDSLEGEIAALEALLGPTDMAQEMAERIEEQMDKTPSQPSVEFHESYRSGWAHGLREARGHLARYLEPSA